MENQVPGDGISVDELASTIPDEVNRRIIEMLRDPGFIQDPYPTYRYLLQHAPVWPTPGGTVLFSRYEPCRYTRRRELEDFGGRAGHPDLPGRNELRKEWVQWASLIGTDPPEHTRLRNILNEAAFTKRVISRIQHKLDKFTDDLIDGIAGKGSMDLMADFARPLPTYVITELLGIPYESKEDWEPWANTIHRATGKPLFLPEQREEAGKQFVAAKEAGDQEAEYFRQIIEQRRRKGERRDDVISALTDAEDRGELTERQVLGTLVLLIGGGHHTTVNLIGNGMLALLRNPDQLELLRSDLSLLPNAIEEMLRVDPPLQSGGGGRPIRDVVMDGVLIKKGTEVQTIIAAANRDPLVFADPDRFDIRRENAKRHLSFGFGIHACLGSFLARAEGITAFKALLQRLPDIRLLDENPPYEDIYSLRGLASLPISWDASKAA